MDKKETLVRELEDLSEISLQEVLDFVRFLKAKTAQERMEMALLSEEVLRKDWLKPEEDEAWQSL